MSFTGPSHSREFNFEWLRLLDRRMECFSAWSWYLHFTWLCQGTEAGEGNEPPLLCGIWLHSSCGMGREPWNLLGFSWPTGQPRNCPPCNYPIFLLRYHLFLHQESLTKVTTCLKAAHDQQLTPLSNLDVPWSKRWKIIKKKYVLLTVVVPPWFNDRKVFFFSVVFFFNPLVIQHSYGKSPYE